MQLNKKITKKKQKNFHFSFKQTLIKRFIAFLGINNLFMAPEGF